MLKARVENATQFLNKNERKLLGTSTLKVRSKLWHRVHC